MPMARFNGTIGSIGDPPYKMDLDYFIKPDSEAFAAGLATLGKWQHDTFHAVMALRVGLSKGER